MEEKKQFILTTKKSILAFCFVLCLAAIVITALKLMSGDNEVYGEQGQEYVIFGMNDFGMHCYQQNYSAFLILPPGNTLRVQVIKNEGGEAHLVDAGIEVTYELIDHTNSSDDTNFWDYAKYYGFDVAPNVGITGNGLSGVFVLSEDRKYYEATYIPATPYFDGSNELAPYQMARVTVTDLNTGVVLASTDDIVVPVSDEMLCSACHGDNNTDLNILKAHDALSGTNLLDELKKGNRYKCANCHSDNALGLTGMTGVPPLSEAMHGFHSNVMALSDITPNCYSCHPGPLTQCYRGSMYIAGISCDDPKCHGTMANIAKTQAEGRQAWLQEPDCAACHGPLYGANPGVLYSDSYLTNSPGEEMDDILLCESCHNGMHAIWKSSLYQDNLLPYSLQGIKSYIQKCAVCHTGEGKVHTGMTE